MESEDSLPYSNHPAMKPILRQCNSSITSQSASSRSILMSPSLTFLIFSGGLFASGVPTKPTDHIFRLHACYMSRIRHFLWFDYPTNVCSYHACFLQWKLVDYLPTPKLLVQSLSTVRDCVFNIFAAIIYTWRPSAVFYFQRGDLQCNGADLVRRT
jgi:hypothetical protein